MVEERGRTLEAALAEHGVQTRLVGMVVGPTVTRYELELGAGREGHPGHQPPQGHRLRDGAARRAHPRPDPGQQAIGVEVPNDNRQLVAARRHPRLARGARPPPTRSRSAIGRDIDGRAVMVNLATMPHILIAGATGAGKSIVHQLAASRRCSCARRPTRCA